MRCFIRWLYKMGNTPQAPHWMKQFTEWKKTLQASIRWPCFIWWVAPAPFGEVSFGETMTLFWLEYHRPDSSAFARRRSSYQAIQPTCESHLYVASKWLVSYRQWMCLLHNNAFIHGPFDFAMTTNRRHSKDRVSVKDWHILEDAGQNVSSVVLVILSNEMIRNTS